jgi:phosphatidate cytidylyltransferase
MLGFVYLLGREHGFAMTLLIFISSWVCDTFAYFSGRALGKRKLAPVLSPKKSIEGAVGGVVGSALVGALFARITGMDMALIVFISAIGAVVSQFGDLFASAIKRNHNIKDYGNLIPGHGGILDRFDSVIITAPIIYILSEVLLK